ncbi:unnamed protein product, partial [Ectocarpus sp. 12 AP-2014]
SNLFTLISIILASIGAINWGLVGIFDFNLVAYLLGDYTIATRVIYVLVGISGVWSLGCCYK